jgi:hypothetical protein
MHRKKGVSVLRKCLQNHTVQAILDIFINLQVLRSDSMDVVEAIYKDGMLRVLDPSKIDSDLITVKILNIEEVLSAEEDLLKEALSEREKGKYHTFEEVFG